MLIAELLHAGGKMSQVAERLLTKWETAEIVRAPVRTLDRWRMLGIGPVGFKVGKRVLYREADVHRWLAEQRRITGRGDIA
jgi:phage terminase Nu1 subunit (DNA packaging protein)